MAYQHYELNQSEQSLDYPGPIRVDQTHMTDATRIAGKCPACSPDIRSPRHSCLQFRPKLNLHRLHNQQQQRRRQQRLHEPGACGGATTRY